MSKDDNKVIGYRQSIDYINRSRVCKAFVAQDADENIKNELLMLLEQNQVEYELVSSMRELGKAHGIKVGATIVCLLN